MTVGSIAISLNGLIIRNIDLADDWTIIFYRAFSFSLAIFLYLIFKYRNEFLKKIIEIKFYGLLGGVVLSLSNICFILSMTSTTVANTVFTISLIPFLTAFLSFLILKEKLAKITIFTMLLAFGGGINNVLWCFVNRGIVGEHTCSFCCYLFLNLYHNFEEK